MRILSAAIFLSLLVGSGCRGEKKVAEDYAAKLSAVVKAYRQQVDRKINAERAAYVELAKVYQQAEEQSTGASLTQYTQERAEKLIDSIQQNAGKQVWISDVHTELRAYAELDFTETSSLVAQEMDSHRRFIVNLEDLQRQSVNVQKLVSLLGDLAEPEGRFQRAKAFAQFGGEVNKQLEILETCSAIKALNEEIAKLDARLAATAAAIAGEKDDARKKQLVTEKAALEEKKTGVGNDQKQATANLAKLGGACPSGA